MILEAEAERQSRILRAEGERAALFLQAQGQAKSIETVFQAIHDGKPDQGLLAYQYLQTLPQIAQGDANKMWIVPSEFSKALEAGRPRWCRREQVLDGRRCIRRRAHRTPGGRDRHQQLVRVAVAQGRRPARGEDQADQHHQHDPGVPVPPPLSEVTPSCRRTASTAPSRPTPAAAR